jgi:protein phosphatase
MVEKGGGKGYAPAMAGSAGLMLIWDASAATDRGRVRRRNEDAVLMRPERGLYAVADGMGGHAAGNVASALAVATLDAAIPRAPGPRMGAPRLSLNLQQAVDRANHAILQRSTTTPSEAGMGTTLTALATLRSAPSCVIAHIGDSRAYRFRAVSGTGGADGAGTGLQQLTTDHTWVQQQVDAGALSMEEARTHPWSSILTRVLGMEQPGPPDVLVCTVAADDVLLLCSDGLTAMLSDAEIAAILSQPATGSGWCSQLIAAANDKGGRDNISVIVLRARSATSKPGLSTEKHS